MKENRKRRLMVLAIIFGAMAAILAVGFVIPERKAMPCGTAASYNAASYWTWPWTRGKGGHPHLGVDIFGKIGTPVEAHTGGIVLQAGDWGGTAGNMVTVVGPKWRIYTYMHLDSVSVKVGEWLSVGEQIGTLGCTGNARNTPPHVHFEVITPIPYVWLYFDDYGKKGIPSKYSWMKMFWLNPADHLPRK